MGVAKGTKSPLYWKEESSYNTAPSSSPDWNELPFNSETFDEQIDTVQSEDIQSNRENPAIRGGNIATRGGLVHDFTPGRTLTFFKHLLAGNVVTIHMESGADGVTNTDTSFVSASAAFVSTMVGLNIAIVGEGTKVISAVTNGTTLVLGVATSGSNTGVKYLVGAKLMAITTAYNRGEYVLSVDGTQIWICKFGGTTSGTVTGFNTAGTLGADVDNGTATFQYVGPLATELYIHTITPGIDLPTGGLAFEKGIKGGTSNLYVQFLGCRIQSLELTIPQQGAVKANWNILAGKSVNNATTSGAGTPSVTGEDFFMGHDGFIHLNDTVGPAGKVFKDFSLTFGNNLDESVYCISNRFRTDLPEGRKVGNGRFGMYFLDSTEYGYFKNETVVPLAYSFMRNGNYFKQEFPEVKLTGSGTPKISGQGAVLQQFDWTAFFQNNTTKPGKVTMVNQIATLLA